MAKKRVNGEGTIYYDKRRKVYRAMLTTPAGRRMTKQSKDADTVRDWLNEQRLLIGRNQHIEPHGITVGEWLDTWLETYAKHNTRPRTYDRYCSLLDRAKPIRNIRLVNLSSSDLQNLYNNLSQIYAGSTMKHIHFCLSGAFKQAVINNLININPCDRVQTPKAGKALIEIFTTAEVSSMLKAAKKYPCPQIILLAYTTGMRLSEILALDWSSVNLLNGTISIIRTIHRSFSAGLYFADCKTASSRRVISIPKEVVNELKKYRLSSGRSEGLLFVNRANNPYDSTAYTSRVFNKIKADCGIQGKGFHSFRHTHASELIKKGVPIPDVSARLGHSKISTTLDVYSHCVPSVKNIINEHISDVLATL
jgi:integrase